MEPFVLTTSRFRLDQPGGADVDDIAAFCVDPVFERFMVTPWPYERRHAQYFVDEFVPAGWPDDARSGPAGSVGSGSRFGPNRLPEPTDAAGTRAASPDVDG